MRTAPHTDSESALVIERPVIHAGVELIGEFQGSGYTESPSLVRRGDGQILQLPRILYEVLSAIDGRRDYTEIASLASDAVQRTLDPSDVEFLIDERLRPQYLVANADGSSTPLRQPDPFLAFRYRIGVVSERVSGALGTTFKPLFWPPIVVILLLGLLLADWWIFFDRGVAQALRQALYHPGLFLPLLGAVVVSAAFHETGHAAACRYGGAWPGRMGCGLYLAWPAFYTDVSDSYRLSRGGRLRTDLGGVYFNVVVILVTATAYAMTRNLEALLLLVVIEHLEIVHQLLPVVRLDGYYIVADLTGVPDLFARIGPILRSLLFWRRPDGRVTALKRWVRVAVTSWVLIVVPLLVLEVLIVLIHLPRILGTSWDSGRQLARAAARAVDRGSVLDGSADVLQIVVLAIPIAGLLLMIQGLLRRGSVWLWRATRGRPCRRTVAAIAVATFFAALALAWIPGRNYRPIQPGERGTEAQGLHALFSLAGGPGPLYSAGGSAGRTGGPVSRPTPATPLPTSPVPSSPRPAPLEPSRSPGVLPGSPNGGPTQPSLPPLTTPGLTVPTVPLPSVPLPTVPPTTIPKLTIPTVTVP
jgi:putative peptide zinc metalloprotease protein